jgi:hypothetical protein
MNPQNEHTPSTHSHLRVASSRYRDSLTLSDEARSRIRGAVAAFARENPAAENVTPREVVWPGAPVAWYSRETLFARVTVKPLLAVLALAVLAGGGVSYAAEVALPGDSLYWVKTDVNEKVGDALAVTSRAQVSWDARKVERRLEEATTLAADGRLDPRAQAEIESRVDESLTEFARSVSNVRADYPDAAHSATADFEAALRAHQSVLARFGANEEEKGAKTDAVVAVAAHAKVAADNVATVRASLEDEGEEKDSYFQTAAEAKADAAKREVTHARTLIEGVHARENSSSQVEAQASASLAQAADAYAKGDLSARRGDYRRAFASYQDAHEFAEEAKLIAVTGPIMIAKDERKENVQKRGSASVEGDADEDGSGNGAKEDEPEGDEKKDDGGEDDSQEEFQSLKSDSHLNVEVESKAKAEKGSGIELPSLKLNEAVKVEASTGLF